MNVGHRVIKDPAFILWSRLVKGMSESDLQTRLNVSACSHAKYN